MRTASMVAKRSWCAKCRFSARRAEFLFGTVWADSEMHALELLQQAWLKLCPYPVEWISVLPGALVFVNDEEQDHGS